MSRAIRRLVALELLPLEMQVLDLAARLLGPFIKSALVGGPSAHSLITAPPPLAARLAKLIDG